MYKRILKLWSTCTVKREVNLKSKDQSKNSHSCGLPQFLATLNIFSAFDSWFHLLNTFFSYFHSPPLLCADLRKSSWCSAPANRDPNKPLILASCLLHSPTFIRPRLWFLFFTTVSTIYYHRFSITSFLFVCNSTQVQLLCTSALHHPITNISTRTKHFKPDTHW